MTKTKINSILLYTFMLYGVLYFFNPAVIYSDTGPIKYIRFIIIFVYFIINLNKLKLNRFKVWTLGALTLLLLFVCSTSKANYDWTNYINFLLPTLFPICFPDLISTSVNINRLCLVTYVISCTLAYIEYFIFGGLFTKFSVSGYRVISIFVNPNNFGTVLVVLTCVLLYKYQWAGAYKLIIIANTLFVTYLTGSRTALISLLVVISIYIFQGVDVHRKISRRRIVLFIIVLYLLIGLILYLKYANVQFDVRDLIRQSFSNKFSIFQDARMDANRNFIAKIKNNPVFPWKTGFENLDNIYFFVWGRFGIFGFLSVLILLILSLERVIKCKDQLYLSLWILFFAVGITTNYLYTWPLAYFYWHYISRLFRYARMNSKVKGL